MKNTTGFGSNRTVVSVSDLNRSARRLLEGEFPMVYVEGEISNFARPSSGHWYLTLKDDNAQLRTAMFRNRNQRLRFSPANGMQVIVRGKISLYEGRGEYQLIAEHMEEAGDGALQRAFEKLKGDLQLEGLFDEDRKQPIPAMPDHVGIITSPTGAAIHDVLTVMHRRFPAIKISILPVQVQGEGSAAQIAAAIAAANKHQSHPFDVLLLTRGGGSLEDLWSFNTEIVARAIADSAIPIISAVGHESDISISDFVADLRAATPSAAAELMTPDIRTWLSTLFRIHNDLTEAMAATMAEKSTHLNHLTKRLRHPGQRVQDLQQRLDDLEIRLTSNFRYRLGQPDLKGLSTRLVSAMRLHLERLASRTSLCAKGLISPMAQIKEAQATNQNLAATLSRAMTHIQERKRATLGGAVKKLDTLSPLATLDRGYAIVTADDGAIIRALEDTRVGNRIHARVAGGNIQAEVKALSPSGTRRGHQ